MKRWAVMIALALVALAGCGKDGEKKQTGVTPADSIATPESISPDSTLEVR